LKQLLDQLKEFWCLAMHAEIMWPYGGHYQCRTCLREYPVRFADRPARRAVRDERFSGAAAFRRA